ncbi:hypothetical protein AAHB56_05245, partial [Bacillus thuringiensis]
GITSFSSGRWCLTFGNKPSYVFSAFIVETLSRFSCAAYHMMCFMLKEDEIRMYICVEKLIRLRIFSGILRIYFLSSKGLT